MDLLEINRRILSVKRDHMNHTMKYKKVVKKIISLINIPEVLYKFILNFVGSSQFPMNLYCRYYRSIHPRFVLKNTALSHHKTLEETKDQAQ
jgi:hypothetical protein